MQRRALNKKVFMAPNYHTQLMDGSDGVIDLFFFFFFLLSTTEFESSVLCDKKKRRGSVVES